VEGSGDGVVWVEIDRKTDNSDVNQKNATRTWEVTSGKDTWFRFVRFQQIGKAHSGKDFLALSAFELFGSIRTSGD
jgi:hypothetical protein